MLNKFIDVISLSEKKCITPIKGNLKYATHENFLGRIVKGYSPDAIDVCLLTKEVARALCEAQDYFVENHQFGLLIYDAYRPDRAVQDFMHWVNQKPAGENELKRKQIHYPHLEKNKLVKLGYLADGVSRHSFGNTVDAVLISINDGKELNMGGVFDYFDETSHYIANVDAIGEQALHNRRLFADGMKKFGFQVHEKEFWHFDFHQREVDLPADFEITKELKGLGVLKESSQ